MIRKKINQLFNELEIIKKMDIITDKVTIEVVKVTTPDFMSVYIKKFGGNELVETFQGKFGTYRLKIITMETFIEIKVVSENVPLDKVRLVLEEAKKLITQ